MANGVLDYSTHPDASADASLTLTKATLDRIQLAELKIDDALAHGDVKIEGQKAAFEDFLGLLDKFDFWFNIVTP